MGGGVLLGLLLALLLGRTGLLLALGLQIVGGGIVLTLPTEDTEDARQQPGESATAGASGAEGASQGIEAGAVHGAVPSLLRTNRCASHSSASEPPRTSVFLSRRSGHGTSSVRCPSAPHAMP